jgi:hypothetical protein
MGDPLLIVKSGEEEQIRLKNGQGDDLRMTPYAEELKGYGTQNRLISFAQRC